MKVEEIFGRISEAYDLGEGVEADEEGVYRIEMDDVVVAFRAFAEEEKLISWVELGPLPKGSHLALYRAMLRDSFGGGLNDGASFAILDDQIVLQRIDSLVEADERRPMEVASSLAACAKPWIKTLAEVNHEAE